MAKKHAKSRRQLAREQYLRENPPPAVEPPRHPLSRDCPRCSGAGEVDRNICPACYGSGRDAPRKPGRLRGKYNPHAE